MLADRRARNARISRQGAYNARTAGELFQEASTLRIGQGGEDPRARIGLVRSHARILTTC